MTGRAKSLLTLDEMSPKEMSAVISLAIKLKKSRSQPRLLGGKSLAMIFEKPSTRTRVSFEVGMHQLGGHAVSLAAGDMQLARGESIEDTGRTLSRYADAVLARVFDHGTLERLAASASVPVINGLSNSYHPCQILADLMTVRERKGRLKGLRLAWIGDGNNVCNSMLYGCAKAGISVAVASPKGYGPDDSAVRKARQQTDVSLTADPLKAAAGADVVATDTFASIHNRDAARRARAFLPRYRVGSQIMRAADRGAIFLHCLPAKRGREVEAGVIDGPQSAVWDEAENRLHAQKALLVHLMGRKRMRLPLA